MNAKEHAQAASSSRNFHHVRVGRGDCTEEADSILLKKKSVSLFFLSQNVSGDLKLTHTNIHVVYIQNKKQKYVLVEVFK